jgi:hypothetical protein
VSVSEPPDQRSYGEWLRRVFHALREPMLSQTASRLRHGHVSAGTVIVRQGEPAESLYLPVAYQDVWLRTVRSACHALAAPLKRSTFEMIGGSA